MDHTLITNCVLRQIRHGELSWQFGSISPVMQAMLVMALPDICAELLARRDADSTDANPIERIEGLARNTTDELATMSAQIDTIEDSTARAEAMITEVLTSLHWGNKPLRAPTNAITAS